MQQQKQERQPLSTTSVSMSVMVDDTEMGPEGRFSPPTTRNRAHRQRSRRSNRNSKSKSRSRSRSPSSRPCRMPSTNACQILRCLQDKEKRAKLIHELVTRDYDEALHLRFYASVEEFEQQTDKRKKEAMGKKLIALFLQPGSMHEVSFVSNDVKKNIIKSRKLSAHTFDAAKDEVLQNLEQHQRVVDLAKSL